MQRVVSEWKDIETSVLASMKEAIREGGVRAIVEVGPKKKSHIVTLVGTVWLVRWAFVEGSGEGTVYRR